MSLPKTARAAVDAEYGKPIEIRELPVPREDELEPGALLVRVDVASICGSDVHQWDGMTQALAPAQLPIVLGHEMMDTVQAALFVRKQATVLGAHNRPTSASSGRPSSPCAARARATTSRRC